MVLFTSVSYHSLEKFQVKIIMKFPECQRHFINRTCTKSVNITLNYESIPFHRIVFKINMHVKLPSLSLKSFNPFIESNSSKNLSTSQHIVLRRGKGLGNQRIFRVCNHCESIVQKNKWHYLLTGSSVSGEQKVVPYQNDPVFSISKVRITQKVELLMFF